MENLTADRRLTTVGVLRERAPGEHRVALIPAVVTALVKAGWRVLVESGAGAAAGFADELYAARGADVLELERVLEADALLQVRPGGASPDLDVERFRPGQVIIGLADPLAGEGSSNALAGRGLTVFALELIPRITRAQSMDVLSSQATIAGYKAVLLAANALPKIFPMLITAAGTIVPARALVIGAGVAGLQAIATARRLGAVVEAYDVRPAAKDEVESLGARFVELPLQPGDAADSSGYAKALGEAFYIRQQELLGGVVAASDVVITTAQIPGKRAPVLVTREAVTRMAMGSVIVDLAAGQGGNCELSRPDQVVEHHGVSIFGPTNLPATVPRNASEMYAKNVSAFLLHLMPEGPASIDWSDEITASTLVARDGEIVHPRVREALGLPPLPASEAVVGELVGRVAS